jgi:predicted nucleic acid-binding protein
MHHCGRALPRKGASVGSRDLLIGATAIALGYCIATRDRRGFWKIPGLEVIVL